MSNIARIACLSAALMTLSTGYGLGRDLVRQFAAPLCVAGAEPTPDCPPPPVEAELRMVQLQNSTSEREQLVQLTKRLVEGQKGCLVCNMR